jgi:hypothetical protein
MTTELKAPRSTTELQGLVTNVTSTETSKRAKYYSSRTRVRDDDDVAAAVWIGLLMTIDSGWVRVCKEEAPHAFTPRMPFRPKCAVLDGMPMLMAGGHIEVGLPKP